MKKIIWIFGESATGKKTFIETIINKLDLSLIENLGIENKRIDIVERTISKNTSSFDNVSTEKSRHNEILDCIKHFVERPIE